MTDIELNKLGVKADSLPNDWLVTLINPKTGEPAELMTVARFIELLTDRMPVANLNRKGVLQRGAYANVQTAINPSKIIRLFNDQGRYNAIVFVNDRFRSFAMSIINNWGSIIVTNLTGNKNSDVKIKKKDRSLFIYFDMTNTDIDVSGIATLGTLSLTVEDYDATSGYIDVL